MKKFVKLVLIVGGVTLVAKLVTAKKAKWRDLTESDVREKLDSRLAGRVPDEKRAVIADKVVSKMRERGVLRAEQEPTPPSDGHGEGSGSGDAAADAETEDTNEPA